MPNLTENQLKWVEALESEEYKQDEARLGVLTLVNDDGSKSHCCLGVACELFARNGGKLRVEERYDDVIQGTTTVSYDLRDSELPPAVAEWLGLLGTNINPIIGDHTAITLNDDQRLTFPEIAARIRKNGLR